MSLIAAVGGRVDVRALERAIAVPRTRLSAEVEWLRDWGMLRRSASYTLECSNEFISEAVGHQFASTDLPQLSVRLETETARFSRVDAARMAERRGSHEAASRHYLSAGREAIGFGAYTDAANLIERALECADDVRSVARARFWRGELYLAMRRYADAQADYSHLVARITGLHGALAAVCRARHAQVMTMLDPEMANAALDVVANIPVQKLRRVAPKAAAEVLLANAAIAIISGSIVRTLDAIRRLQTELDSTPTNPRWLELAAALCKLKLLSQGHAAALPLSQEYMLRARAAGDPSDLAGSLMVGAIVLTAAGNLPAAEALYNEVEALVSTHGIVGFSHIHALNHAVALMEMGDTEAALDRLSALRAYDNSISVRYYVAFDDLNLATAHYEQGNHEAAQFFANEAIAKKDAFPRREYVAAVALLGLIAAKRCEHRRADDLAAEVDSLDQVGGDLSYGAMLAAERLIHAGNGQKAVARLLESAAQLHPIYKPASLRLLATAAEIQADFDPDAAARLAQRCKVDASDGGMNAIASKCKAVLACLSS